MITPNKRVRMAGNVDSSDISEAIKHFQIPSNLTVEGVEVPISLVQLVDGTKRPIPFVSGSAPWGNGLPRMVRDATANDSDKSFTVPAGKIWNLRSVAMTLVCTATVGNRVLEARVTDVAGDIIAIGPRTAAITAGQSSSYLWVSGGLSSTATGDMASLNDGSTVNVIKIASTIPFNGFLLTEGFTVRCLDVGAIDAAADDLTIVLTYEEYDA